MTCHSSTPAFTAIFDTWMSGHGTTFRILLPDPTGGHFDPAVLNVTQQARQKFSCITGVSMTLQHLVTSGAHQIL
jgi:hypothetical protein